MSESIWSVDAHGRSLHDAACEFAATFWDKPRRVIYVTVHTVIAEARFSVSNDSAIYTISRLHQAGRPATYQVKRD